MSPIPARFPVPENEDVFEKLCLHVLRQYWSRPKLDLFGKRGERQFGIDILDVGGEPSIYAAQCKLKEPHKNLPPADIQREVDEAKRFKPPLSKYTILTTAKISTAAQLKIREINRLHKDLGLFEVELMTWEKISALLQQYTDVQEQFYDGFTPQRAGRIETSVIGIQASVEALTTKVEGDAIDSQINEARNCIVKQEFQLAILLLNRIENNHGDKLTARQKYRVASNHGAALLGLGKASDAATKFIEGAGWQPDDEQGKINEALAFLLVDDAPACYAKASSLRQQYPNSARLAGLWLNSAPKESLFSVLESETNSILRTDPEVALALARRSLAEFDFDNATKYSLSAKQSAPNWSQTALVLAQVNLGKAIKVQMGIQSPPRSQDSVLLEAELACTEALELSRKEKNEQTETMALVLRTDIRLLQKRTIDATEDAESAARLTTNDPAVILALAQVRFASGKTEQGIDLLAKAYQLNQRPDIAFSYGRALQNRDQAGDADTALKVLSSISLTDLPAELRLVTATHTLQSFAKKIAWSDAEDYICRFENTLARGAILVLRGYAAFYQNKKSEAETMALSAISTLAPRSPTDAKELLARLLMLLGNSSHALPIWKELFDSGAPAFNPNNLLECAAKLNRDDVVMSTCAELRARGVDDWSLVEFELQYLEKYKIDAAIESVTGFIRRHPENKLAKIRLSLIGLRLDKPDLVMNAKEDFPPVSQLPLHYAIPAVQVMKYGGNPDAALDYAYEYLREHFYEIEAHQALITSMIPGPFAPSIPPTLEVAGPNSAVCYQELPDGRPTWVVLEETNKPSPQFEEVSLSSPTGTHLSGRRVGDTVLVEGKFQNRRLKVIEIIPKYVRRYQDSLVEMQMRFGAESSVESFRVDLADENNPTRGFDSFLATIEKQAEAAVDVRAQYDAQPVSLHSYGSWFGKTAYEGLQNLAIEDLQRVKCCLGTLSERRQANSALQTAKGVVVEMSALATIRLLDLEKILTLKKFHFIISERTWINFRERLSDARIFPPPAGTLYYRGGKHMMYEESVEDRARTSSGR